MGAVVNNCLRLWKASEAAGDQVKPEFPFLSMEVRGAATRLKLRMKRR